jgi:undecaprenyl-phosphate 4-deoxy-4-formamido-L-arabinose transferase
MPQESAMSSPALSVVIPIYNEEQGLPALFARLYPALDRLDTTYEVIFVDDGSRDRSAALLRQQFEQRSEVTRVVLFAHNYGQHLAIMAGFERCRGERIVTLDADLQNPPEEISKLLAKMDEGHDYVGGVRTRRADPWFRRNASRLLNFLRERTTHIHMTDQGCMLRAYSRPIVNAINACTEVNVFIPALGYTFAQSPSEVVVEHAERTAGSSKYSFYKLLRLNFDLVTGFSLAPLQVFSLAGFVLATGAMGLVIFQIGRRLVIGEAAQGLFDSVIEGLEMFLSGLVLFGIGLLGEYIGRIYQEVLRRPRFLISGVLEKPVAEVSPPTEKKVAAEVRSEQLAGIK